ncbi:MAG: hypothetical protein A2W99_03225 [Bacteroidetes bacterium GWF2_33_16]|nr:MAG: hypothetical protein A2X00_09790 [Bacteroidetes bacterium GWE2_32_14]OFY07905.1 MAG: hypothetical protein A2W99_03225 [Bacteroidetes bacterium GWF2_33_16]
MLKLFRLVFLVIIISPQLFAQIAPNKYRIYFTDKNYSGFSIEHPEEFLSEKAINRRERQNIQIIENDLPVSKFYIDSLKALGLNILNTSKWQNTVTIYSTNQILLDTLHHIGFIKSIQKKSTEEISSLVQTNYKSTHSISEVTNSNIDYGDSGNQIRLHNGHILHQNGFWGQGITIAVIDAGFYNVDILPAFDSLLENNQIQAIYDFVDNDDFVFDANNHGMKVLSIIGGNIPGQLIGAAPKANFLLLRSEDVNSEYSIEEDNWAAAAEFADSAGADIINTSLGYTVFDDLSLNYSYRDMNGNTAFITKAADIAASKGILVVVSAGNQGNATWRYISAPADGDSVLTVGAVNAFASYVEFSSQGPSSDGRIKPNVAATGYQTILQDVSGQVSKGNGTSFSAPIISGLAACLWQAMPELTNMEILDRIEQSSHQYSNPDYKIGYGVPDFAKAANLTNAISKRNDGYSIKAYPNPFTQQLSLYLNISKFSNSPIIVELYNVLGQQLYNKELFTTNNILIIDNLDNLSKGIYIVKITIDNKTHQIKVSKLN